MHRCLVLNANYEYLSVLDHWIDAVTLVLRGKADPIATYERVARSEHRAYPLPAVLVTRALIKTHRRRAIFDVPAKTIVLARDAFTCQYCGCKVSLKTGTRDHVQPRSRGGPDILANVVAACSPCNRRKEDRTPAEAGMPLRSQPRALSEEEKVGCLLRTVRSEERSAWIGCLRRNGITLWTARAA
jgi:5-methylcytosine-specific restriction endonuclease McrA